MQGVRIGGGKIRQVLTAQLQEDTDPLVDYAAYLFYVGICNEQFNRSQGIQAKIVVPRQNILLPIFKAMGEFESNETHIRYTVHPFIISNMREKSNGDTVNEHMPFNTTV